MVPGTCEAFAKCLGLEGAGLVFFRLLSTVLTSQEKQAPRPKLPGSSSSRERGAESVGVELGWAYDAARDLCTSLGCQLPSKLDGLNRSKKFKGK